MLTYNPRDRHNTNWQMAYKHDAFTKQEIKDIQSIAKNISEQTGMTGPHIGHEDPHRKSTVKWLRIADIKLKWIFDRVSTEISELNNHCWNYELYGFDTIQYTIYKPGDFYNWHMDSHLGPSNSSEPPRKLSATILLNDNFEGGEFQFYMGDHEPQSVEMKAGSLIVFPSFLYHRVAPVTKGIRNSLVAWVLGPKFK